MILRLCHRFMADKRGGQWGARRPSPPGRRRGLRTGPSGRSRKGKVGRADRIGSSLRLIQGEDDPEGLVDLQERRLVQAAAGPAQPLADVDGMHLQAIRQGQTGKAVGRRWLHGDVGLDPGLLLGPRGQRHHLDDGDPLVVDVVGDHHGCLRIPRLADHGMTSLSPHNPGIEA